MRLVCVIVVWTYFAAVSAVALAIHLFGDVTWWGSVLLFGPRWVWALPAPVALAACLALLRRPSDKLLPATRVPWTIPCSLPVLAAILVTTSAVAVFFVLGVCVPWRTWRIGRANDADVTLRMMTLNMGASRVDLDAVAHMIVEERIDLVAFQEAPTGAEACLPDEWSSIRSGDMMVASRFPLAQRAIVPRSEIPGRYPRPIALAVEVSSAPGTFVFVTVHPYSPRYGLVRMLDRRTVLAPWRSDQWKRETQWRWAEHRQVHAAVEPIHQPLVVAGDFNTPVESRLYREFWGEFRNAFSRAGWGMGHTIRIEEGGFGLSSRIDHVLVTDAWYVRAARVGTSVGSDHLPVIAELGRRVDAIDRR